MSNLTSRDARLAWLLFGLAICIYVLSAGGHFYSSDAHQKFLVVTAMLEDGIAAIDGGWVQGRHGMRYAWFPLGASLIMLPGYVVGRMLAAALPWLPAHDVERLVISFQNAATTAALLVGVFLVARLLGHRPRAALGAALALGFATMAWPYAKSAWSEPPATLALFLGLICLWWASRPERPDREALRGLAAGGAILGLAILIRQELALVLAGATAWLWVVRDSRRPLSGQALLAFATPILASFALHMAYEYARYGTWLALPNYRLPVSGAAAFGPPEKAYRFLVSPNQGLLVFSPAALLGLAGLRRWCGRAPALAGLLAASLLPLLGFYVFGWGPSSWSWGMRYAYVFLPFLMLPAAEVFERPLRWWMRVTLAAGLAVQLLALPYDFVYLFQRELAATPGARIQVITTDPARGPLVLAYKALPELLAGTRSSWRPPRADEPITQALRQARADMVPDFWWCLYRRAPIAPSLLNGLAAALALAALAFAFALARAAREAANAQGGPATGPPCGV
ncbi:MAG: hypothetical protein VKS61_18915 [Candidatus Sericytochromatia bacterium]|nr:hypothetical protein [Candidatus Sericytochromatia bacterium]